MTNKHTEILIVDDEIGIREVLQETLEDEGYTVACAENAEEARKMRIQLRPSLVLLDIWMPDSDGITLLKEWATSGLLTMPVVMMSGHGSIDTAVEATKIGALDFLEKPIPLQKLLQTVERALKHGETQAQSMLIGNNLGNSSVIKELNKQLEHATRHNGHILLIGEAGCPFETVAKMFQKPNMPLVEVRRPEHLVDLPMDLLEKASGGILYLGDMAQYDKSIQQSIGFLLSKAERCNVRIICTSSRPVNEWLNHNADTRLSCLLSGSVIHLPSLRHQSEDIPFLAGQILRELSNSLPEPLDVKFTSSAFNRLRQYEWPGNIEQLRNVVKSLAMNCKNHEIHDGDVVRMLNQFEENDTEQEIKGGFNFNLPLRELREELERRYFEFHIQQENHNMSRVAQKVGLERTHLYRKLKQLGITFTRRSNANSE